MRMKFLSGGKLQMNKRIFVPNSNKEEKITLPVISTFIEHKSTKILFDTGCHPSVHTEPKTVSYTHLTLPTTPYV